MKKPRTDFSKDKKWEVYAISITLQICAWILSIIRRREITHAFYYSERQANLSKDNLYHFLDPPICKRKNTFRGKEYSEMRGLEHGWSNWEDARIVGLGSIKDVAHNIGIRDQPEDIAIMSDEIEREEQ